MAEYDRETGEVYAEPPAPVTHRWSNPAGSIFEALAKAQVEVKNAIKDNINPHFKSKFADLSSVRDACWEALTKNGISIVQMPVNGAGNNIGVVTLFGHASGQWIESSIFVAPMKFDAQGAGSVITYLRRYALAAMAGVAPEDDDGNAAVARPDQGRAGAPLTQGSAPRSGTVPHTTQAATAPSETKAEATKRYRELMGLIDSSMTVPDAEGWIGCPAWDACRTWIVKSEEELNNPNPDTIADTAMDGLRNRIEKRKDMLLAQGDYR